MAAMRAIAVVVLLAACRAAPAPAPFTAGPASVPVEARCDTTTRVDGVRVVADLAYAAPGGDTLRLDLALPAGDGPHPVVVLLHGGGWEKGGRGAMRREAQLLAARGLAAATVSYRLVRGREHAFPAAVRDAACAVRWLRANAAAHGLDRSRVAALGFSAGAHLASMLGVRAPATAGSDGCLASGGDASVLGVVAIAGPQDLRVRGGYTRRQARLVTGFLGVFPGDAPGRAAEASPIAHVDAGDAPFLLLHGDRDPLVPLDHPRRMLAALHAAGVAATLVESPGARHRNWSVDAIDTPRAGCTIARFLGERLR